jgi:dihydroxyacetone kinase-like protein
MKKIKIPEIKTVFLKAADALNANSDYLTTLDQEVGDGDLGITAKKIAAALTAYIEQDISDNDTGKFIMAAGIKINSTAPSTLGSLIAIALMKAGKVVKGESEFDTKQLAEMINTAVSEMMEKGKAKLGDKTIIDALHPAAEAFQDAVERNESLSDATKAMAAAALAGMDHVTPLKSQIGRAGWVGDRTIGKIDPGCALAVVVINQFID